MDETTLLNWIANQGLAIALSCFLVWFVTDRISKTLSTIADVLVKHDTKFEAACQQMNTMNEKLDKIYDVVTGK